MTNTITRFITLKGNPMRNSLFAMVLFSILLLSAMLSAVPVHITHQGRLTDAGGRAVDSFFDITFRIYSDSTGGTHHWQETQGVNVIDGMFSVRLGTSTPLDFSEMPAHPDFLWLGIQLGSDAPLSPRTRLSSVPSAAVASELRGDISSNNGVMVMLDSLGDTTIVLNGKKGDMVQLIGMSNGMRMSTSGSRSILKTYFETGDVPTEASIFATTDTSGMLLRHTTGSWDTEIVSMSLSRSASLTTSYGNGIDDDCDGVVSADSSGASLRANWSDGFDNDCDGIVTANSDGASMSLGASNATGGVAVASVVSKDDLDGHVTVLKISDTGSDTIFLARLFGDPDFAVLELNDPQESSNYSVRAGGGSISNRAARTGRNPQTGATIQMSAETNLNDTSGASISLRHLDPDSDDDGLLDLIVDDGGVSLRMNKGELIDAMASGRMSVDTSGASLSLSKADAKRALEAVTSSSRVGLYLIDSTLNDSGLIGMEISDGNSGISVKSAKKVAKFKAGAALAKAVNKAVTPDSNSPDGTSLELVGDLDHFVEITVDSVSSSLVFADTLGDTTIILSATAGDPGELHIISTGDPAIGVAPSRVSIADLDSDGLVDVRVDGNVGIGVANPTTILQVQQGSLTDPIADAWTTYSSRRWKENIRTINNAVDVVRQLRGVTYQWKTNGKPDIGLIAEEVGAVIPEIVVFEENGIDAKSVDYSRLVAILIEASKEQQSEIDLLRAELARLNTEFTNLANKTKTNKNNSYGMK